MAKKKITKEEEIEEVVEETTVETPATGENHPEYDPSIPENKQRWVR